LKLIVTLGPARCLEGLHPIHMS